MVDRGFHPHSDEIKDYKIGILNFSTKHVALRIKSNAGFTYRLDRLKPRASKYKGPPANAVLSKQPYSNFPDTVALYFRILQIF